MSTIQDWTSAKKSALVELRTKNLRTFMLNYAQYTFAVPRNLQEVTSSYLIVSNKKKKKNVASVNNKNRDC